MAFVEVRALISAPPDRVWEVISDLEGQRDWMVDVRSLSVSSEAKSGPGAVVEVTSELFGLPVVHDVMEVTVWEPPRELSVLHRGQFSGLGSFIIEPLRGGSLFIWQERFEPPLGRAGKLAHALLIRPHLQRVFRRSLNNLRALAERPRRTD